MGAGSLPSAHQRIGIDRPIDVAGERSFHVLPPLEADVKQCKLTTRMADPGTLSRQRRTLRNFNQALVRLTRYQLQELDNGCLSFFRRGLPPSGPDRF